MASGGAKKTSSLNGNYKQRGQQQWTVLPNNLDLRSNMQSSKKQQNKEDLVIDKSLSYPNMRETNSNQISTAHPSYKLSLEWQNEQQLLSDSDHTESNQNLYRQHRQSTGYPTSQMSGDTGERGIVENSVLRPYKEDNTKKVPDTSTIVERLMHLRDCIKEVLSIIRNLEKSDQPVSRDQMKRLNNMLKQLQQEEQQHFDLLQQMLITNEESSVSPDTQDGIYATSNNVEPEGEPNGEIEETIEHGQMLLQKMVESQEKMESLKKQQEDLLTMQKQAEDKLAEAKSFHAALMKKEEAVKNQMGKLNYPPDWNTGTDQPSYKREGRNLDEADTAWSSLRARHSETNLTCERMQTFPSLEDAEALPSRGIEGAFENLKQHLQYLQDMDNNKMTKVSSERVPTEQMQTKDTKSELHRKKLENKLKELQAKKKHMDKMLVELSALEQASVASKNGQGNSSEFVAADTSIEEAQHLLDTIDAREKVKKLEEMKESLSQLRAMVNSIQLSPLNVETASNEDHAEIISNSSRSSSQVTQHRSDTPKLQHYPQQNSQAKKDNIKHNHLNKFPMRRHYEAEGRANEDGDNVTPSSSVQGGNSSIDESWESDPQVQEKIKKLQDAKQKLQKLQGLMSAVQSSRETGCPATIEYLQLLSAISDEEKQEEIIQDKNYLNSNESNECSEREAVDVANHQRDLIRLEAVEERMQHQQEELEKLMEERRKLLLMQNQLTKLQQQFPNTPVNEKLRLQHKSSKQSCSNTNSLSSRSLSPNHKIRSDNRLLEQQNISYDQSNSNVKSHTDSRLTVNKKDNINSMSANLSGRIKDGKDDLISVDTNEITMDSLLAQANDLDHSVTLQEIKQNVLLKDILRQNRDKQQRYSHNEDIQSHSGSSANSEFQEGSNSVLAPDATVAATWGGSSTQNDFEDEQMESLEEQDASETEAPCEENVWQVQNKGSLIEQSYRKEIAQGQQDIASEMRRDNRIGSQQNFKGENVNRWNSRKNFHHEQQRNHLPAAHNQDNVCGMNRLHMEEPATPQNLITSDGTHNMAVWQQFTHHIQQQLENVNTLCQSIFQDQQTLTSCLLSCSISSPSLYMLHQCTHQFQQQQQLLLSLSQCYHMIYLQQLEIQYLHQCLQQNANSDHELLQTSPAINQDHVPEEFTFRPWLTAPSANVHSSFPTVQVSPIPSSPFVQSNIDNSALPVTSNAPNNSFNISTPISSNCTFPRETAVAATLNNQVPPRTRANNFWDNFRSYSRQNMLSTSKSNETISANLSALQIPTSENTASATVGDHPTQMKSQPYAEKTANSDNRRPKTRHVPKRQENVIKSNKPNASKDQDPFGYTNKSGNPQMMTSKLKSVGKPARQKEVQLSSARNSVLDAPMCTESSGSWFPAYHDIRHSESENKNPSNTNKMQESVYAEVSKIISQAEGQPEVLLDFLKKLKHLRSDSQKSSSSVQTSQASESQHSSQKEVHTNKNKRLTQPIANRETDFYSDHVNVTSQSLPNPPPLKDIHKDGSNYSVMQSKTESSIMIPSVAAATGAVTKRMSNKRPKMEHSSLPPVNGIGRNADYSENSSEKPDKIEYHMVVQEELDTRPEQEDKIAVGVDISSHICQQVINRSTQNAEDDMGYECDPEGETEPEVEAETDDTKDLAEADQSPGQRTSTIDHFRQIESSQSTLSSNTSNFVLSNSGIRNETASSASLAADILVGNANDTQELATGGELMQPNNDNLQLVDELTLDDIPTKLSTLSEDEVQKQIAEETIATSTIQDVLSSEELPDVVQEQGQF